MKNIGCRWPKQILIEVRDEENRLIDSTIVNIQSWNEIMPLGEMFAKEVIDIWDCDEVYWSYEELK